jgi:hypothetical protein
MLNFFLNERKKEKIKKEKRRKLREMLVTTK